MNRLKKQIFIVFIVVFSCQRTKKIETTKLPFFNSVEMTPKWISKESSEYKSIHKVPEFKFFNQENKLITEKTYNNKIYIANFFFTKCAGICPKLTKNMKILQKKFINDDEVLLISHSVTPFHDSVSVLKKYAEENNVINYKWNLVTGKKDHIYEIARKGYFVDENFMMRGGENTFLHTEKFVLVDKKKRIRGVYNGTLAFEMQRLIKHIDILKKEK